VSVERAYRFVPIGEDGIPREPSNYTLTTDELLDVGSPVEASLLGFERWMVVEMRSEPRPLLAAQDASGRDLPLAGTVVCKGTRVRA